MSHDFEFHFPAVKVSKIKLDNLSVPIKKSFKKDYYYYLSASLDNQNGSAQFLYKGMHYTFENLYVVGKINSDTNNLIISYKSVNDYDNKTPIASLFVLFPLTITSESNDTNVISGLIDAGYKKTSSVNSISLNSLLQEPSDSTSQKGSYPFSHYSRVLNSGITNMDIFVYQSTTKVYSAYKSKLAKWLGVENQKFYPKPISLTPLKDTLKNKKPDLKVFLNQNLTKEEQIYIQCAPAGASTHTEVVKVNAKNDSKTDSDNLSFFKILI
jgi:hypothetical protein